MAREASSKTHGMDPRTLEVFYLLVKELVGDAVANVVAHFSKTIHIDKERDPVQLFITL